MIKKLVEKKVIEIRCSPLNYKLITLHLFTLLWLNLLLNIRLCKSKQIFTIYFSSFLVYFAPFGYQMPKAMMLGRYPFYIGGKNLKPSLKTAFQFFVYSLSDKFLLLDFSIYGIILQLFDKDTFDLHLISYLYLPMCQSIYLSINIYRENILVKHV